MIATGAQYGKDQWKTCHALRRRRLLWCDLCGTQLCGREEEVIVVGGNSAGEAAVFLGR